MVPADVPVLAWIFWPDILDDMISKRWSKRKHGEDGSIRVLGHTIFILKIWSSHLTPLIEKCNQQGHVIKVMSLADLYL